MIFWRNLGGSLITLPFALRHKLDRDGMRWAILAGVVLCFHFMGFFLAMRLTSVAAGIALTAIQPIFAALFLKLRGGDIPNRACLCFSEGRKTRSGDNKQQWKDQTEHLHRGIFRSARGFRDQQRHWVECNFSHAQPFVHLQF